MGKTIVITNRKGGCGKTVTAANLGAGLVRQGKFVCENPICVHYHVDGAVCAEVQRFDSRAVGHFYCGDCGMRYKISKAKVLKGVTVITDYGHLWKNELIRCSQDKNISNAQIAEILKCDIAVMMLQKKKLGLLRPRRYDVTIGPEAYYKAKVNELCEEYGEVTYSLLQEKIPGAYEYLIDHHTEWIRERVTTRWKTEKHLEYVEYTLKKAQKAIEYITVNLPQKQISYGYIAEIAGLTRDNLRSSLRIRAYVENFVESRKDWHLRHFREIYHTQPIEGRPYTAVEICRAASMDMKTYTKYRELFEEVVNELNSNKTKI